MRRDEAAKLMEQAGRLEGMALMLEMAPDPELVANAIAGMRAVATEIEQTVAGVHPVR